MTPIYIIDNLMSYKCIPR